MMETVLSEAQASNCKKSSCLKALRMVLIVLAAAVMTGCGLLEPDEVMESSKVKQDVLKLCGAGDNYSPSDVKVLDWNYNVDVIGDAYTGYLVTYEIGTGYYALVSLIEFDNSSRYELELIYRGRSLSDLNNHLY